MPSVRRWLMGRKQRELADFIGEKVDYLFRWVRDPSGWEYTVEEVAQATRLSISGLLTTHVQFLGRYALASYAAEKRMGTL